jgi:hypothetical protein
MKMSQYALERDEEDRFYEGPDQEPPAAAMSVALPLLAEVVAVLLLFACAFVWCGIGSGRI